MSFLDPYFLYFILLFFPIYFFLSARDPRQASVFVGLSSFLFVFWFFPAYSLILLFQLLVIHGFYLNRLSLAIAIVLTVIPLLVFKYSAFLGQLVGVDIQQLPLPLGISFYTFTAIAVLVEINRSAELRARYSSLASLKILAFWPHLASGPVLRPNDLWRSVVAFAERDFKLAAVMIALGLFKKIVIGDGAGTIVSRALELGVDNLSVLDVAYMSLAMSVQIYGDFSGYSDMALGFALFIGVRLPANFNFPYLASSITEFWRRWHISLTSWFRDYLYIPLGGSRGSQARTYCNMMIVFVVSGLWHGAAINFIWWGLLHGGLLILERVTSFHLLPAFLRRVVVIPVLVFSWLVFFLDTDQLAALFSTEIFTRPSNADALGPSVLFFVLLFIIEHMVPSYRVDVEGYPQVTKAGLILCPVVIVLASVLWSEPLPFIYFDF